MPSIHRRTVLGALVAGSVGLAGCSSSCPDSDSPAPSTVLRSGEAGSGFEQVPGGSWPTPRFDAGNTGYAPSHTPPTDTPSLRWRTTVRAPPVDGVGARASAPTVADGRVTLATGAGVVALALRDGSERWVNTEVTPATSGATYGYESELAPPVVGEAVYVATTSGVAALRPDDGSVAWEFTGAAATGVPTPAEDGGALIVPTTDGVVALDAADGRPRWTAAASGATLPAVADGTAVVAGEELIALDAVSGDLLWTADERAEFYPVVADGTVFVGSYGGIVGVALDDGTERWTVDRGGGRAFSAPVVTPETVYTVERPGEAGDATFALDRTGEGQPEPRWCSYVGEGSVTAAAGGHAFALQSGGSNGGDPVQLVAFTDRFGEAAWGYAAAESAVPPAVLDGGLVLANRDGTVVGIGGA